MSLTFTASAAEGNPPKLDEDIYDGRFDGVEPKTLEQSQFGNPDVFIWHFTVLEDGEPVYDDGEPITVDAITSRSTNTKSKTTPRAVRYLKALMTADEFAAFEKGESVGADDLLGRMVQLQITIKENGWPKVEDVLAARRSRKAGAK